MSPAGRRRAHEFVAFCALYLRHSKGRWAGRPFELAPWQVRDIARPVFGRLLPDGRRQTRTALVEIPRKNGKSQIAAAVGIYLFCADGELGAEVYSCAGDKDQARVVFGEAKRMVEASPELIAAGIKVYKDVIFDPNTQSTYRVLSADAPTKHGLNPHGVIFDELHTQPLRDLWDVMTTGQGTREQPLTFATTTAGVDKQSICYELHEYAASLRSGTRQDPSFYSLHYGAGKRDDWTSPRVWRKANPALGSFLRLEFLQNEYQQAAELAGRENAFRQLYLNQWVEQATRWITMVRWDASAGHPSIVTVETLAGREVWGGLDLGSVSDLTALVYVAACPDGGLDLALRCWVPEAMLERKANPRNALLYQQWHAAGLLLTTPGDATDYDAVKAQILRDREVVAIQGIGYDKGFQGQQLAMQLQDEGVEMLPMGQAAYHQDPQIRAFERLLLAKQLHHGGHPILRFAAEHAIVRRDGENRMKLDKRKSQEKIDPLTALLLAIDAHERRAEGGSVYDARAAAATDDAPGSVLQSL